MHNETLRDTARRLIANYRLKRGGSPARLVDAGAPAVKTSAPEEIAERLAEDRAFLFDITLTDRDARFLESLRIDPNG